MAIDFPYDPAPNQQFAAAGRTWVWNADIQAWEAPSIDYTPVNRDGDRMRGQLDGTVLRATGNVATEAGAGVELVFDPEDKTGRIQSYDRDARAWLDLRIRAANLAFEHNGLRSAHISGRTWDFDLTPTVGGLRVSLEDHAHAEYLPFTGGTLTGPLQLAADPTAPMHAATRRYVDSIAQGLGVRDACRAATTANISLSGIQTIDGVALAAGNRVLVKNQTNPAQNGIYIVSSGAWTRASDMDEWPEVLSAFTFIEQGAVNGKTGWASTTNKPSGVVGTDAIHWVQFSAAGVYTGSGGIILSGSDFRLADMAANTLKGRVSSSGAPQDLTVAQVRSMLGLGSAAYAPTTDFAPASHNHNNLYLLLSGGTLTGNLTINASGTGVLSMGTSAGWGKVEAPGTLYLNYENYTRPIVMGRAGQSLAVTIHGTLNATGNISVNSQSVWHAGNFNPASKMDASALSTLMANRGSVASGSMDSALSYGFYLGSYTGYSSSLLVFGTGGSTSTVQIEAHYSGVLRWRNRTGSSNWTAWRTIWHSGNDGANSGLDADTLDGYHASAFALASHTHAYLPATTAGSYWGYAANTQRGGYYGLLFGTTTSHVGAMFTPSGTGGFYSQAYNGGGARWLLYYNGTDWFVNGSASTKVWHAGNDGAGSGLDADLLDGLQSTAFLRNSTGVWLTSADGVQRFHFGTNSHTYVKSASNIYLRTGNNDTNRFTFDTSGNFTATGNVTAFSDRRLKHDLARIESALSKVRRLTGYTYTITKTGQRSTGLIAQDVDAVLSEAVHKHDDGSLSLAYGNLMGLMVEAIKELDALVADLQRKVA